MIEINKIYCEDCLETMARMPDNFIDLIITDPPYPDYYQEKFGYYEGIINFLNKFKCRQLIFWSAKVDFPLDYTARHIWDKMTGAACQYDFIYERNGGKRQKIYRGHRINSIVSAQFAKDTFENHPSQKPIRLIVELVKEYSEINDLIADFFMGSGTTAIACIKENRNWIGSEISDKYCKIAEKRIKYEQSKLKLPLAV